MRCHVLAKTYQIIALAATGIDNTWLRCGPRKNRRSGKAPHYLNVKRVGERLIIPTIEETTARSDHRCSFAHRRQSSGGTKKIYIARFRDVKRVPASTAQRAIKLPQRRLTKRTIEPLCDLRRVGPGRESEVHFVALFAPPQTRSRASTAISITLQLFPRAKAIDEKEPEVLESILPGEQLRLADPLVIGDRALAEADLRGA